MNRGRAFNLEEYLSRKTFAVNRALDAHLGSRKGFPPEIMKAMRYSLFAGGKRLRPLLAIAAAEAVGGTERDGMPAACAVEMIHTYSLIHDDLPAMDNSDLRRGRATSHRVFGDAMAILAGDALLTEAFCVLALSPARGGARTRRLLEAGAEIASAASASGMVGGQVADIRASGKRMGLPGLTKLCAMKTGALITASVSSGAILGGGTRAQVKRLARYGGAVGLAFQVRDDILDKTASEDETGKDAGADERNRKTTFPDLLGVDGAWRRVRALVHGAKAELKPFGARGIPLAEIAGMIARGPGA
jgi:geranylgeranyl diphosphate synthase type II